VIKAEASPPVEQEITLRMSMSDARKLQTLANHYTCGVTNPKAYPAEVAEKVGQIQHDLWTALDEAIGLS
jgi:hypothetical protein